MQPFKAERASSIFSRRYRSTYAYIVTPPEGAAYAVVPQFNQDRVCVRKNLPSKKEEKYRALQNLGGWVRREEANYLEIGAWRRLSGRDFYVAVRGDEIVFLEGPIESALALDRKLPK